jgi:hypothetical protein
VPEQHWQGNCAENQQAAGPLHGTESFAKQDKAAKHAPDRVECIDQPRFGRGGGVITISQKVTRPGVRSAACSVWGIRP